MTLVNFEQDLSSNMEQLGNTALTERVKTCKIANPKRIYPGAWRCTRRVVHTSCASSLLVGNHFSVEASGLLFYALDSLAHSLNPSSAKSCTCEHTWHNILCSRKRTQKIGCPQPLAFHHETFMYSTVHIQHETLWYAYQSWLPWHAMSQVVVWEKNYDASIEAHDMHNTLCYRFRSHIDNRPVDVQVEVES